MKGVKAVYETPLDGPVKVRVLAIYSTYAGLPRQAICKVTSRSNRAWPQGFLFRMLPVFLWERHRYVGKLKCNSLYQGRPDLSGLPEADENLIKQWEQQR